MIAKPLTLVALLLACYSAGAQGTQPDFDQADRYFAAYLEGKIEALAPMMAETIHFQDSASDFRGQRAVLEGLGSVFAQLTIDDFAERARFHSGNVAIYEGQVRFTFAGEALGVPGTEFHFDTAFIVALTMEGDKVAHHVDYVDTDAFRTQLREQIRRLRTEQ